ncbi:restriction endonuclease subunit S [Clostridium sporogenes]|uniref:Restriction modification system DNA specificity domain-containing protein n=1 Tax=Clostridium sporogenes TaxID=1509 RepID=A0A7U4JPB8_CLOSG|nr:restriction endonuclease subunit S [Clostridium sporogenes]AKC62820.1 restriction modification system DNA specificity domain-containing protein [Clostridium sporogenes]AKJ90071.1 hypothetical protein CLSPOx_10575 [Clostridium sporogenes]KCZ68198.1 restriction modification system DNA specificity domain-containing protein [Clostridium sporogenes]KOY64360.1 hypothetical protein AN649_18750 [Clostridium sporogenes]OOO65334.1 hypothetical protein BS099_15720 [Clostridium sporogenes]
MEYFIMNKNPNVVWVTEKDIDNAWISSEYYNPVFLDIEKKFLDRKFDIYKFNEIADINRVAGFEVEKYLEIVDKGIPYLRVKNICECFIDFNDLYYIPQYVHKQFKKSQFKKNDIAMTITGRVGTAAIINDESTEYNASQDVVKISIKRDDIDTYYMTIYLNTKINHSLLNRFNSGGSRQRTLINNVREIKIPIPPPQIQKYIGDKVRKAQKLRCEAKKLDEICEQKIKKVFLVSENQNLYNNNAGNKSLEYDDYPIKIFISGNEIKDRLDSKAYHPEYYRTLKELKDKQLKCMKLIDMLDHYSTGKSSPEYDMEGIPILMTKNIKNNYIDWNCKKISNENLNKQDIVSKEEVLITTYGGPSIGKVDILFEDKLVSFDYTILKLKFNENFNPYFMTLLLRSKFIQNQMRYMIKGTTGITFVIPKEILNILIPVVNKAEQDDIGNIYKEALSKIKISKQLIQEAKQDVEDLIEGNFDMSKLN